MARVVIIIVSYEVKDLLKNCLKSVFRYTRGIPFSVIVVDNDSKDGSAQMVEKNFPEVTLIKNMDNLGFAKANNQALKETNSPYILFLNPDTFFIDDAVFEMCRYLKDYPEVALVGPQLLRQDGSIQPSAYRKFPNLLLTFLEYCMPLQYFLVSSRFHPHNLRIRQDEKEAVEIAHLLGACFMVRKKTLDELGFFDERFFIHREETDLCRRLKARGYKLMILPWVKIHHYGARSTESLGVHHTAASPYYLKSLYLYHQKYQAGKVNSLLLALAIMSGSLITFVCAIFSSPLSLFSSKVRKRIRVYLITPIRVLSWHFDQVLPFTVSSCNKDA